MKRMIMALPAAALALALVGCGGHQTADKDSETDSDDKSTTYAHAVQNWNPYLEVWRVDGDQIQYSRINCMAQEKKVVAGTLVNGTITWDGANPQTGYGEDSPTSVEITEDSLKVVGSPDTAVTDLEGQKTAHIETCKDAGESVGEIILN